MAIAARGEVKFTFKGKELSLRPDIEAIEEIEENLNMPLLKLSNDFSNNAGVGLKKTSIIIWAGLNGHFRNLGKINDAPRLIDVKEELYQIGQTDLKLILAVGSFLTNAVTTPDEIKAQVRATASKKKEK